MIFRSASRETVRYHEITLESPNLCHDRSLRRRRRRRRHEHRNFPVRARIAFSVAETVVMRFHIVPPPPHTYTYRIRINLYSQVYKRRSMRICTSRRAVLPCPTVFPAN